MVRSLVRALAIAVLGGGSVLLSPAAVTPTADAATCTAAGGVSVVVDFRELGGSTITACAADGGGRSSAEVFASVGVNLSYATRQPGFVCRVQGAPAADPCVNASPSSAYWGLWWADGSQASWTYSSYGVGSLTVPAGGSLGWSWQQDRENSGAVPPAVAPPVAPAPAVSASPTSPPTSSPASGSSSLTPSPTTPGSGGGGGSGGSGGSGGIGGSGASGGSGDGGSSASPSPTASPSASSSASPSVTPSEPGDSPSESPLTSESSSDASATAGAGKGPLASESPSGSSASAGPRPTAGASAASEPTRVPAAVTWGVVGLLGVAIAISALVARRRRVTDAS